MIAEQPPFESQIAAALHDAIKQLVPDASPPSVERSKAGFSSDYQSGAAMQLAKALKKAPKVIADELAAVLAADSRFARVEASGPGFLGFTLSPAVLQDALARCLASDHLAVPAPPKERVVIDFSSPNVAKRMHVGHIRSTIIGDALQRIGRFLGHDVIADNHIGDWGTQFGTLLVAWKRWRDEVAFADDPVGELERLYRDFHERSKADESLMDAARAELQKLQKGDPENRALWQLFIDRSRHTFDEIYERLSVRFDVTLGESFYNEALQPLVERLIRDGIAEVGEEGAIVVFFRDEAGNDTLPPFLIRKKDGAALYATTDIATIEHRIATWQPSRIVYVTDTRQQLHFKQLFATARRLSVTTRLDHVWFGMMTLPDGAFSTREGNVIPLHELLDEAERRALATLRERAREGGEQFDPDELQRLARQIGLGAVKYADLSNAPQTNIVFSFDKMLAFDGNTAVYLQYTSARTASLLRKARRERELRPDEATVQLEAGEERELLLHLLGFGSAVHAAWERGAPNVIASYLYELATRYHRFYQACPVLWAEPKELAISRLNLSLLTRRTLSRGLSLLGIEAPDRM